MKRFAILTSLFMACGGDGGLEAPPPGQALSAAEVEAVCADLCGRLGECGVDTGGCTGQCAAEFAELRGDLLLDYRDCFVGQDCSNVTMQDDCEELFDDVPLRPIHQEYLEICEARSEECLGEALDCSYDMERFGAYSDAFVAAAIACWEGPCEEALACLEEVFGDI
jgi:hypothetical protein